MLILNVLIVISCFLIMEMVAWATHKYIMHGFMWYFHKDHHQKDHDHAWERNDIFFLIFAAPAILFIYFGYQTGDLADPRIWIGAGITLYGMFYLFVHDIFSHQRIKIFTRTNAAYFRALRKAHKLHHKNLGKYDGVHFGFLFVPMAYIEAEKRTVN